MGMKSIVFRHHHLDDHHLPVLPVACAFTAPVAAYHRLIESVDENNKSNTKRIEWAAD
jgi:hypothetical protein